MNRSSNGRSPLEDYHSVRQPSGENNELSRRSLTTALLAVAGLAGAGWGGEVAEARDITTAPGVGSTARWADSVDKLRTLTGSPTEHLLILLGYYVPADGGGGIFAWSDSSTAADDGGTVFRPAGITGPGRWLRLVSGDTISVKWFGSKGDGLSDDTQAIQKAFDAAPYLQLGAASNLCNVARITQLTGGSTAIEFPQGKYKLSDEITIDPASHNQFMTVVSTARAILVQSNCDKRIFAARSEIAYSIRITGLVFLYGTTQIYLTNGNLDGTVWRIDHCEFQGSSSIAIQAVPEKTVGLSALITVDECKFYDCAGVLKAWGDPARFVNCWVSGPKGADRGTVMFDNRANLEIVGMLGVPSVDADPDPSLRWIDNYGNLRVEHTRFGGESAGIPIIYHYAPLPDDFPWLGSQIIIRDSNVYSGNTGNPNRAVVNLVAGCPQTFIYEGNQGPAAPPLIQVLPRTGFNLDDHLNIHPNNRLLYRIDSNVSSGALAIPAPLVSFVNLLDSNGFPAGARPGSTFPELTPSQSQVGYYIPASLAGFVAMVTISLDPRDDLSSSYRTMATYIVSMTTGGDSTGTHAINSLSFTPLFLPTTPTLASPTIIRVVFDSPHGQPTRLVSRGGNFFIVYDSHSPHAIRSSYATVQMIHAIL